MAKAKGTPATNALAQAGVPFSIETYHFEHGDSHIALQAAAAVAEPPERVLKTLMLLVDGKPACAVIASDKELAMKKAAAAFGGKSAEMMKPADAERITGYHVGGISPFGQRKKVRTVLSAAALSEPYLIINGGGRGIMVKLTPADAVTALDALTAEIVA